MVRSSGPRPRDRLCPAAVHGPARWIDDRPVRRRKHPEPSTYAATFTGTYSHRTIEGGIGHNLPQEAPEAFADAVLEVAGAK